MLSTALSELIPDREPGITWSSSRCGPNSSPSPLNPAPPNKTLTIIPRILGGADISGINLKTMEGWAGRILTKWFYKTILIMKEFTSSTTSQLLLQHPTGRRSRILTVLAWTLKHFQCKAIGTSPTIWNAWNIVVKKTGSDLFALLYMIDLLTLPFLNCKLPEDRECP